MDGNDTVINIPDESPAYDNEDEELKNLREIYNSTHVEQLALVDLKNQIS